MPSVFFKIKKMNTLFLKLKKNWLFFLAVLCLHCCTWAFSICSGRTSHCGGFSCCGAQTLGQLGSGVVVHELCCSEACGILPGQGTSPCPHWQADS